MWNRWNSHTLLLGIQNGTVTMGKAGSEKTNTPINRYKNYGKSMVTHGGKMCASGWRAQRSFFITFLWIWNCLLNTECKSVISFCILHKQVQSLSHYLYYDWIQFKLKYKMLNKYKSNLGGKQNISIYNSLIFPQDNNFG